MSVLPLDSPLAINTPDILCYISNFTYKYILSPIQVLLSVRDVDVLHHVYHYILHGHNITAVTYKY